MSFDAIVVGLGGVGSAALYHLAAQGHRVLGLDTHPRGHFFGSSHGETRVIRLAYFEHPDYVPLLRQAYLGWAQLEAKTQQTLYLRTGALQVGPPGGEVVPGILASAQKYGLSVTQMDSKQVSTQFPGFVIPEGAEAVFEAEAGILRVEACVLAHLQAAEALGAKIITGAECLGYGPDGSGVWVQTTQGRYQAGALALAAGAWSGQLLARQNLPLVLVKKTQFWYPSTPNYWAPQAPVFLYELPEGIFYGIPALSGQGVKVAQHSDGQTIAQPVPPDAPVPPEEISAVDTFARKYLPYLPRPAQSSAGCMYTLTPDRHFIADLHPELSHGAYVAGLSGHGFKFAPVLGQVLADLTVRGQTALPVDFMSARRFQRPGL